MNYISKEYSLDSIIFFTSRKITSGKPSTLYYDKVWIHLITSIHISVS